MTHRGGTRRALITGGSSGIGLAASQLLRDSGWHVVVLDRVPPPGSDSFEFVECDLREGPTAGVGRWAEQESPLDALVHCAGICDSVPLVDETPEHVDETFRVNVYPAILLTQLMLPRLRRSAGPAVVLTGSVQASLATPRSVTYSATKGALEALTRSLAVDLAEDGIRVNCVAPGTVKTPLWRRVQLSLGRTEEQMAAHGTGRRLGVPTTPGQVAQVVSFLADSASSGINGTVIAVDNGLAAVLAS